MDWRSFIDASKSRLKAVLLQWQCILSCSSCILASMKMIFAEVKYKEHNWNVSGDPKVVALIMGLQLGRARNSCFTCAWISTAKIEHYHATWEKRSSFGIGITNVKENS